MTSKAIHFIAILSVSYEIEFNIDVALAKQFATNALRKSTRVLSHIKTLVTAIISFVFFS